jgi:hypothetical protein
MSEPNNQEPTTVPETTTKPAEEQTPKVEDSSAPVVEDESPEKGYGLPVKQEPSKAADTSPQVGFSWEKQLNLKELTFKDVLLWKNIYVSLILFLSGQAVHLLLTKYEFSVLTLVGRIVLIQVLIFFLYNVGTRIIQNIPKNADLPLGDLKLSQEVIQPIVQTIVDKINSGLNFYVDILMCKDLGRTVKFAAVVQLLCWIGKIMSGTTFLYLAFNLAFIVPKVYELKQKEIDQVIALGQSKASEIWNKFMLAVPKSDKVKSQ